MHPEVNGNGYRIPRTNVFRCYRELAWLIAMLFCSVDVAIADPARYFGIRVVDSVTGEGVPLVELETLHHLRFVTDNAGWVAIDEPELMEREIFFAVRSHGYEYPKDGFGFAGLKLKVNAGERATLSIVRRNLAERVGRSTGAGLLRDSVLLGLPQDSTPKPSDIRADVAGCDSVLTNEYRDRRYWFWGDTTRLHYPIGGSFHMTGATTSLESTPPKFGSDPLGNAEYFVDPAGAARALAKMPGDGPTWITAVTTIHDTTGIPRMLASYVKVRNMLEPYRWGFVQWDDNSETFVLVNSTDTRPVLFPEPQSHAFRIADGNDAYVYFCNPFPFLRVLQRDYVHTEAYEGYSCLQTGTVWNDARLDRTENGELVWKWRAGTPSPTQAELIEGLRQGVFQPGDRLPLLIDIDNGRRLHAHFGSVAWNAYRGKWIAVFCELGGESSMLGEVYMAEAGALEGPWVRAKKILTHDRYSFYNPKLHSFMDEEGGRFIYFEGTYSNTFSGNEHPTPRYDYNQVLYRLDLAQPELWASESSK